MDRHNRHKASSERRPEGDGPTTVGWAAAPQVRNRLTRQLSQSLRHSFVTHLLERGYDIPTVQELRGHKHVGTTMIPTQLLKRGRRGVRSPIDPP